MGLGHMGLEMARRVLAAGHELRVHNRTRAKVTELESAGAQYCPTPREACAGAHAVIAMTTDDSSSQALWLGPNGALAAPLAPKALAIECSTLSHEWVMELATKARALDLRYLDAPVTGLPENAAAGSLTLLVGANRVDLEAARALLSAFSDRILHFGEVGAGTAYKLIVNMIGAVQIASLAEGLALAENAGLDLNIVASAITSGQAASPQVVRNARRIVDDDHDRNIVFTPALRLKDVNYALDFAKSLGKFSPFGQLAAKQLQQLIDRGHSHTNESKIIEIARLQKS